MNSARMKGLVLCLALVACVNEPARRQHESAQPVRGQESAQHVRGQAAAARVRRQEAAPPREPVRGPVQTTSREPVRGPVQTTPQRLFDDFTSPHTDGMALLDKYRDGATFTATIKTVGAEEDGRPVVWIDVDGENLMSLEFDDPAPRDLRAGGQLTVTCKLGGASGALMMVTSCTRS
jgi:hypothetical protein